MEPTEIQTILDELADTRTAVEADIKPSRERSLVLIKIEEAEMWLGKCQPKADEDV